MESDISRFPYTPRTYRGGDEGPVKPFLEFSSVTHSAFPLVTLFLFFLPNFDVSVTYY